MAQYKITIKKKRLPPVFRVRARVRVWARARFSVRSRVRVWVRGRSRFSVWTSVYFVVIFLF